jgi:SAM-dependent methyltransferase
MCAAGGALGGLLVGLIAPLVFTGHWEFKLGLLACYALALAAILRDSACTWFRGRPRWSLLCGLAAFLGFLALLRSHESLALGKVVAASRNFYGVLSVDEAHPDQPQRHSFVLRHGRILHGLQFTAPERRKLPTTYYTRSSGVGLALEGLHPPHGRRIGAVGLGVGTIAAYGRSGDYLRFYEINPDVERLARSHFSYLADSPARIEVILGDARLSLEREPPQAFDLLVLDAFSGDAIPTHLLTLEAFEVYLRHLQPAGLLAIHITNRHVDLNPVVEGLARYFGLHTARIRSDLNEAQGAAASVWLLVARDAEFFARPKIRTALDPAPSASEHSHLLLWRDDYSNLLEVLR